jgi:hypothetical protein
VPPHCTAWQLDRQGRVLAGKTPQREYAATVSLRRTSSAAVSRFSASVRLQSQRGSMRVIPSVSRCSHRPDSDSGSTRVAGRVPFTVAHCCRRRRKSGQSSPCPLQPERADTRSPQKYGAAHLLGSNAPESGQPPTPARSRGVPYPHPAMNKIQSRRSRTVSGVPRQAEWLLAGPDTCSARSKQPCPH